MSSMSMRVLTAMWQRGCWSSGPNPATWTVANWSCQMTTACRPGGMCSSRPPCQWMVTLGPVSDTVRLGHVLVHAVDDDDTVGSEQFLGVAPTRQQPRQHQRGVAVVYLLGPPVEQALCGQAVTQG